MYPLLYARKETNTMKKHKKWAATAAAFGLLLVPVTMEASQSDGPHAETSMSTHHEEMPSSGMMDEGMQGPMVHMLQHTLQDYGISTKADGMFGPEMKQSVKSFQAQADITTDGIVGPQTMTAFQNHMDENVEPLRTGDNSMHVYHVQRLLTHQNIETETDGIFGPETHENVKHYQQKHDLQVDGIIGPETMGHMMENMDPQDHQHMMNNDRNDSHHQMGESTDGHGGMNHSSSGEVPEDLQQAENPEFEEGDKAIIKADHMEGMDGATATIADAYDTTAYEFTFEPTDGGHPVENHKWIIHEEVNNAGEESLQPGDTAEIEATHLEGMDGATATIDRAENTTVYMVDFTTTDGEELTNHKWLTESELRNH